MGWKIYPIAVLLCSLFTAIVNGQQFAWTKSNIGFLSSCSAVFDYSNLLLQSQAFTASPWVRANAVVASPTVTDNVALAPDGSMTAATLALPAVTGANAVSVLTQSVTYLTTFPYTTDIYIQGAVGGETVWLAVKPSNATTFQSIKITATTSWQRVSLSWSGPNSPGSNTIVFEVGVDLRDGMETATLAQTVRLWGAQQIQDTNEFPYLPTTTATVSGQQSQSCPSPVLFRDFSSLVSYPGNPIVPFNTAPWNVSGVDGAFVRSGNVVSGTYYVAMETNNGVNWNDIAMYSGNGSFTWSAAGSNPIITNSAGTWKDHYLLHPSIINLPSSTCETGPWFLYYSALPASGGGSIGVATSATLPGTWTDHGANPVIAGQTAAAALSGVGLPSVIQIGNTLYMYASGTLSGITPSINVYYYTSPATDGCTWTFQGLALRFSTSDWAASLNGFSGYQDPFVFQNSRGWYEMVYTVVWFIGAQLTQKLGYAVSLDGKKWFNYQGGQLLGSSNPTAAFPGDGSFFQDGTTFYLNYANAVNSGNSAQAEVSTMPDH